MKEILNNEEYFDGSKYLNANIIEIVSSQDLGNCYEEKIPHRTNIFSKNKIKCPICGSEKIKKLKIFQRLFFQERSV